MVWDVFLILSVLAFMTIGLYLMIEKGGDLLNKIVP